MAKTPQSDNIYGGKYDRDYNKKRDRVYQLGLGWMPVSSRKLLDMPEIMKKRCKKKDRQYREPRPGK